MSIFDELFAEFPRARVQVLSTPRGIWTQVNIPGIPSMQYTTASPKEQVRIDETEYADFNREPTEVICAIITLAKADREDASRVR